MMFSDSSGDQCTCLSVRPAVAYINTLFSAFSLPEHLAHTYCIDSVCIAFQSPGCIALPVCSQSYEASSGIAPDSLNSQTSMGQHDIDTACALALNPLTCRDSLHKPMGQQPAISDNLEDFFISTFKPCDPCPLQHSSLPISDRPYVMTVSENMKKRKVICIIMGGGRGSRLSPLTTERCKPAVPLAGKYRLVDIPISNCLNSGYNQIFVLTQFNTASLHRHIQESYKFDPFGGGFVDILSAEQTDRDENWYQGTADAVRQNMHHFHGEGEDALYIILSGDQLFRMDLQDVVREHDASGAEVTITAKPLRLDQAEGLGLMRVDDNQEITEFVEKPIDPEVIKGLAIGESVKSKMQDPGDQDYCLASMGIYVFNAKTLVEALDSDTTDFGKEIIPGLLGKNKMHSYVFDNYWEDIGTVKAFFECNIRLTDPLPPFNFFDEESKIYTHARFLPASKINSCVIDKAIFADGCIVTNAEIRSTTLGVRSVVRDKSVLDNVVMMGADYFENEEDFAENEEKGRAHLGVGKNCSIKNTILDKNTRIGDDVVIDPTGIADHFGPDVKVAIRDGVCVVCKDATVPNGFVLKA